ncbi:L10-interacting MYB domain-containing protein-like isoform X2 [Gossypium arboreum]|uniref:Myb/SANT-like domain-containing protein n=2 Tax=Gossypium arboreum TaxID=29729 RepID=A0ABR0N2J3_GOSAR|nr:L10-interacting MYB domain-containing protein-like isoform X2 [Gossypium arboreum]XP_017629796.2 L10-interacting MYB domain-containing protein-like isoform X2 [Gossypium arboreum]XP_017629797.2 L10-interacting MYB domain-containing protein-like isoform X2 [Gossypium arboreum]XP_052876771.1 L10-interacting MYB domain-containing protein-like isoform X2 [Gossypium arboreum]XP_052876772.1 L10-interacting MYB domain-containing protein-like isoform X2 [Gossypium arboreum]XP_052876773.1 L10-intera
MASRVTRSRRQQQPSQQQEQHPRARWTTFLTKTLADLLVEQVHGGNRHNNSFNKRAWKSMCDEFYEKTSLKWDKEQLKNRYGVLRRQYVLVKSLLDRSEFSWNESTGVIIGTDEAWFDFTKGHPDAETIKASGCSIYKQLCTIFSEPMTNWKHDYSAELRGQVPSSLPSLEPLSRIQEESSSSSEEVEDVADDPDAVQPSASVLISSHKRGRRGIDDAIAAAILEMAATSKLRTAAVTQRNARYSILRCIKELDEIEGLEERVYFAALELFNNPNAREIFLSLKGDKRLTWLHCKILYSGMEKGPLCVFGLCLNKFPLPLPVNLRCWLIRRDLLLVADPCV